ncbi:MAG: H(+)-transporting ATPase, partial [Clostridia bacterium]|nr:H(+)-transporting ATPase [Clostridia bacterium]
MLNFLKKQSPARIIALGFLFTIFLGSILLIMPFSVREGVELSYIDSLYTSTSAVCITGLIAVDTLETFTIIGQIIVAMLIQIGGLGVTLIGAGFILAIGKKMNLKGMSIVKEALNLDSGKGLLKLIKEIFITTLIIESIGAILSFIVFIQDFPLMQAIWTSIFHSIAAFNNAGFDILGNLQNLIPYQDNVLLNLTTCFVIIFGGLGFLVIKELWTKKFNWKKFSMHTKVVLTMTTILLIVGTLLIKLTEEITWLGAFFFSVSARTAGFSTFPLSSFTTSGLLTLVILMFIGASPGSTGGGIKTTTFFAILQGVKSAATNTSEKAFHYSMPKDAYKKASIIALMGITIILVGTYIFTLLEPTIPLIDILLEVTSAFGTVGLSTGITPTLSVGAKILSIIIMYIGR